MKTPQPSAFNSDYAVDIGVECHVQLKTASKMFCGCSNDARSAEPNTTVCVVCFGLPGTLPVLNKRAVELAIQAGTALNCQISERTKFDRKNYFYPDLPKGYQITQYDQPIIGRGELEVPLEQETFQVGIVRAHLEEDAGKLVHPAEGEYSLVDLNRAGTPLLEIVSEPDMHSPAQAKAYAQELYFRMLYAQISDVDLYHGNMRFDLNISVRGASSTTLGTRTETKNLNSFRSVERAAEYEIKRQIEVLEGGGAIFQETRGWDEQQTYTMRTKEEADDYRYFPEPDIPPLVVSEEMQQQLRSAMPQQVQEIRAAFHAAGLSATQTEALLNEPQLARLYIQVLESVEDTEAKRHIANWLSGEVVRALHEDSFDRAEFTLSAAQLQELAEMTQNNELNSTAAKQVLLELLGSDRSPRKVAETKNLLQVSDTDELEVLVNQIIADNPKAAQDVQSGEAKAVGFLTGQVMQASQGKANPQKVKELLRQKLQT